MKKVVLLLGLFIGLICLTFTYNARSQSSFYPYNNQLAKNQESILIILDASQSMDEKIDGERKIDMAKNSINQVLSRLSPNIWIGLRVYGHKMGFLGINSCKASELKVAIGPNNQSLISNQLLSIQPVGMTPICYSLDQAINYDFLGKPGKKRIILVSDGMETCSGDPCDFAVNMVRNGSDIKIDVIGFDLNEKIAMSQLKCTALATKGKFYAANNSKDLIDSLNKSFNSSKEVYGKVVK